MRGAPALAIVILFLIPTAVAPPPQQAQNGLANACQHASSNKPCQLAGIIPTTTVGPGQSQTYEDSEWTVDGTITVQSGGSLTLDGATFRFTEDSGGILVNTGGVLTIIGSTLEPSGNDETTYVLDLAAASSFKFNTSTIIGGHGVKLRTSDADVSGSSFEGIPLALHLINLVDLGIGYNQFINNDVAVNQTGGITTLDHNLFQGGTTCVENWLADPTITHNVFRGCHTGIRHVSSQSRIEANDMEDDALPPGTGILVQNTNSPIIENNTIRNYASGITVYNATAYIRNNTITNNGGWGVKVDTNTGPMDIQGNEIAFNDGHGIRLVNAVDVEIFNNDVHDNGQYGILADDASGLRIEGNLARYNGIDGIALVHSTETILEDNLAQFNDATGIVVGIGSNGAQLFGNDADFNGQHGIFVRAPSSLNGNVAAGNGLTGYAVEGTGGVTMANEESHSNAVHGYRFTNAFVDGTELWAHSNGGSGFLLSGTGTHVLVDSTGSSNNDNGFVVWDSVQATLTRANALSNEDHGLISASTGAVTANDAWWEGNGVGVSNLAELTLVTECSYWGASTGPTTPSNPGGTGDSVSGDVDYEPFRPDPSLTSCVVVD